MLFQFLLGLCLALVAPFLVGAAAGTLAPVAAIERWRTVLFRTTLVLAVAGCALISSSTLDGVPPAAARSLDSLECAAAALLPIAASLATIPQHRGWHRRLLWGLAAILAASLSDATGATYLLSGQVPGIGVVPMNGFGLAAPSYCDSHGNAILSIACLAPFVGVIALSHRRGSTALRAASCAALFMFAGSMLTRDHSLNCRCFRRVGVDFAEVECSLF